MNFNIRPYHPSDLVSIYKICLQTGNSGTDATKFYKDPEILASYFAAPYPIYEPEVCFIATADDKPCGYIIGSKDHIKFAERCEKDWLPILRNKYPYPSEEDESKDAWIARRINEGYRIREEYKDYPAELHIDILPIGQGQGLGKKLMNTFIDKLKELKVPALHLEVGKKNQNAIGFYKKYGFHIIKEFELSVGMGINLD